MIETMLSLIEIELFNFYFISERRYRGVLEAQPRRVQYQRA